MQTQQLEEYKNILREELKKEYSLDEILARSSDEVYHAISELGKYAINDVGKKEEVHSLIENFLDHPYAQWRYISLYSLVIRWSDIAYEQYFDRFMFNDDDEDNRILGVTCYEGIYRGTKNKIVLQKILQVFLKDKSDYVKKYAYDALCTIYYSDVDRIAVVKSDLEMKDLKSSEILQRIVNPVFLKEIKQYCEYNDAV